MTDRRAVDWPEILGQEELAPVRRHPKFPGDFASLLAALRELVSSGGTEAALRRAIELARSSIGLQRVGVYLLDERAERMLGTWGTGLDGELVDEHRLMFDVGEEVLGVFRRAESGEEPFSVFDNCPIVLHAGESSRVLGRGWMACTPILSVRARIGMMYNDAGLSGARMDEAKQAQAAILCSLLGNVLEAARSRPTLDGGGARHNAKHPIVIKVVKLLDQDPGLAGKELAGLTGVSLSHLIRSFKSQVGMSLVEYRNRLRIERFLSLVSDGKGSLRDVAKSAGFGSYAQFHRVFRSLYGTAPRSYFRTR